MTDLEFFISRLDETKHIDNSIKKKFFLSFILCFIADLMSSFDFYAMTHDWIITQLFTGLLAQTIWFMSGLFKNRKERVVLFIFRQYLNAKPLFNSLF